jgi:copper chaperone CopZ
MLKKFIALFTFLLFVVAAAFAQKEGGKAEWTTATVRVSGVCGMCEKRIETAAHGKGVKSAEWDADAQTLTVVYKSKNTTVEAIEKRVAAVGHDTEHVRASDAVYSKLHACCQYERVQ